MTQMNLSMKQKETHGHREQTGGCQGGGVWGGMEWEVGVSRCKLLYMEWINNKILLYSTENLLIICCHKPKWKKKKITRFRSK